MANKYSQDLAQQQAEKAMAAEGERRNKNSDYTDMQNNLQLKANLEMLERQTLN